MKGDRSNIVKQKVARNVHVIFYILSVYSLVFISGCAKGNVQESTASVAPEPTVSDAEWNNSSIEESQTTTLNYKESVTEPNYEELAADIALACGSEEIISDINTTKITGNKYGIYGDFVEIQYEYGDIIVDELGMLVSYSLLDYDCTEIDYDEDKIRTNILEIYHKLPLPQEYVLTSLINAGDYIEAYFSREITDGIYSSHEAVKMLAVSDGKRVIECRRFNYPLQQETSDVPLTQAEALQKALDFKQLDAEYFVQGEISTVRPIMEGKAEMFSKLAWILKFDYPTDAGVRSIVIWIDLYSGEYLGEDRTA